MFDYNLYPIFFIINDKTLFTLRASLLLSSSNDSSANIVDDEGSFEFPPNVEFTSSLYVHITLATNTEAAASYFALLFPICNNWPNL